MIGVVAGAGMVLDGIVVMLNGIAVMIVRRVVGVAEGVCWRRGSTERRGLHGGWMPVRLSPWHFSGAMLIFSLSFQF